MTRAASTGDTQIDLSEWPDGKIIVIVQVLDEAGNVTAVRSKTLTKSTGTTVVKNRLAEGQGRIKSVEYYDLSGRLLSAPVNGINIVKITYNDGSVSTVKMNQK